MDAIRFYGTKGEHGCFSNFSRHSIFLNGKRWPTTEHYFQAKKFEGTSHEEEIRRCSSPAIAARMGRSRQRPLRKDWESVKLDVMRAALHAKFTQHEDLRETLLQTEQAKLIEHTTRDRYWGNGGDDSGANWLGRLLMELRANLVVSTV